jgi:hypothetical protein
LGQVLAALRCTLHACLQRACIMCYMRHGKQHAGCEPSPLCMRLLSAGVFVRRALLTGGNGPDAVRCACACLLCSKRQRKASSAHSCYGLLINRQRLNRRACVRRRRACRASA